MGSFLYQVVIRHRSWMMDWSIQRTDDRGLMTETELWSDSR